MQTAQRVTLVALALVLAGAATAQAQTNNASITATAVVQTPINVVGAQGLNFGNVFPGVNKTVLATDLTNAGRFEVTGQASTPVSMTFSVPTTLSDGLGNTLPIDSYDGRNAEDAAQTVAVGSFTPSAAPSAATLSATGQLFVWVGARVVPATNQVGGTYTGSITMTVVY